MRQMDQIDRAAAYWDEHTQKYSDGNTGLFWWEIPEVLRELNRRASGDCAVEWWDYVLRKHLCGRLPLGRCLSLGCGTGKLERDLASRNAFVKCDGYDISPGALDRAKQLSTQEGWTNIDYHIGDVNLLELPDQAYDAVWIYGAMHHFADLERVAAQISRTLTPGGILVACEYVGPARFRFPAKQKALANHCLQLLPARYRRRCPAALDAILQSDRNQRPAEKRSAWSALFGNRRANDRERTDDPHAHAVADAVGFPTPEQVEARDPSESIRSDEILPIVKQRFEIIEKRDLGGNLFQFLFSGIAQNFQDEDPTGVSLARLVLTIEEALLKAGEFESDFVLFVATPKNLVS